MVAPGSVIHDAVGPGAAISHPDDNDLAGEPAARPFEQPSHPAMKRLSGTDRATASRNTGDTSWGWPPPLSEP